MAKTKPDKSPAPGDYVNTNILLPVEMRESLMAIAKENGLSMSELVRMIIRHHLSHGIEIKIKVHPEDII